MELSLLVKMVQQIDTNRKLPCLLRDNLLFCAEFIIWCKTILNSSSRRIHQFLMAYPGARIILLGRNGFSDVRYEETEHYAVTKKFLNNYSDMIKDLFEN